MEQARLHPQTLYHLTQGLIQVQWCLGACLSCDAGMPVPSLTDRFPSSVLTCLQVCPVITGLWLTLITTTGPALCTLLGSGRTVPLLVRALPCLSCCSTLLLAQLSISLTRLHVPLCVPVRIFGSIQAGRPSPQVENNHKQKGDLPFFFFNTKLHKHARKLNNRSCSWTLSLLTMMILL